MLTYFSHLSSVDIICIVGTGVALELELGRKINFTTHSYLSFDSQDGTSIGW